MHITEIVTTCAAVGCFAACSTPPKLHTEVPSESSVVTVAGPGPTLCADLATLTDAARRNFPAMRREDRPITSDHNPGFETTFALANTVACRILTSEEPYPDAYECDLAHASSQAEARAIVKRWADAVGACPAVAGWAAAPPSDDGYTWELEIEGNHELAIHVLASMDDGARPTIVVRMNEI